MSEEAFQHQNCLLMLAWAAGHHPGFTDTGDAAEGSLVTGKSS